MFGIIQKINLTAENPVSVYTDKSSLLGRNPTLVSDDDVVAFVVAFQDVINYSMEFPEGAVPSYYYYDSMDADLIYIYIGFNDEAHWNMVSSSEYYTRYQAAKQKVFDAIGWVDHGIHIVNHVPDEALLQDEQGNLIIDGRAGAEIVWNTASQ